jgi:hypothetical protein
MKKYTALFFILTYSVCFSQPDGVIFKNPDGYAEHFLFNIQSDTLYGNWSHITHIQQPLFGVTSYYWGNSRVFICGGADSSGVPVPYCYFYNITTNSYEPKDTLPEGRYLGKLVRVKDSLYLVGSVGSNFNIPDGKLFRYNPFNNKWLEKAPVPAPFLEEMAVCVWKDSLIIAIGGSNNGFGGAVNTVQVYNPSTNVWRVLANTNNYFLINISAAQAECIDSSIVVIGGYSSVIYNTVYRGLIENDDIESLRWWLPDSLYTPFGTGVYRVGSTQFGNYMLFGPALASSSCINELWGFNIVDSTWIRFLPNSLDVAAIRPVALRITSDSVFLFTFGGIKWDSIYYPINSCEKFSFKNPLIGIAQNGYTVPSVFKLYQNYPNPFNPGTVIRFDVFKAGKVIIKVYDITGRELEILMNETKTPGSYSVRFNAASLSSGIYFYTMKADDYFESKKMVLIK